MRIERREHAFHRRGDEIVVTRFAAIDVILPQQLNRFCEDGYLRVTVVLTRLRCQGVMDAQTKNDKQQANQRAENNPSLHRMNPDRGTIAYRKFLATPEPLTKVERALRARCYRNGGGAALI